MTDDLIRQQKATALWNHNEAKVAHEHVKQRVADVAAAIRKVADAMVRDPFSLLPSNVIDGKRTNPPDAYPAAADEVMNLDALIALVSELRDSRAAIKAAAIECQRQGVAVEQYG
jgi:hypothetical protein